jgi:hypothetical protein
LKIMISCSSSPLVIFIIYIIFICGLLSVLFFCVVVLLFRVSHIFCYALCVVSLCCLFTKQHTTPPHQTEIYS